MSTTISTAIANNSTSTWTMLNKYQYVPIPTKVNTMQFNFLFEPEESKIDVLLVNKYGFHKFIPGFSHPGHMIKLPVYEAPVISQLLEPTTLTTLSYLTFKFSHKDENGVSVYKEVY